MTTLTKTANDLRTDLKTRIREARTAREPKLVEMLEDMLDAMLESADLHSCAFCDDLCSRDNSLCDYCQRAGEEEPEGIEGRRDFYNQR